MFIYPTPQMKFLYLQELFVNPIITRNTNFNGFFPYSIPQLAVISDYVIFPEYVMHVFHSPVLVTPFFITSIFVIAFTITIRSIIVIIITIIIIIKSYHHKSFDFLHFFYIIIKSHFFSNALKSKLGPEVILSQN